MANRSDLELRRLGSTRDAAFERLLEIYTESNEPGERKSPERLGEMIREPAYSFLVGMQSDAVVGYSILRTLDADAALLEYVAVASDLRNQGIGSELLAKTAGLEAFAAKFLLAEVNSDKKVTPDRAERARRKRFYRRLGWREVDRLNYIMPPVSSTPPPEMDMLAYHSELPGSLERDRLRQWLKCIYIEVYHQPSNDPRIEAMMGALPEQVPLI